MKAKLTLFTLAFGLALSAFLSSCTDDPDLRFSIDFSPQWAGSDVVLGQTYTLNDGTPLRFERIRFYVSELSLMEDGKTQAFSSEVNLIDHANLAFSSITMDAPQGEYDGISFGLGIPAAVNGNMDNPDIYELSHPMSVDQDMWWSWNMLYRFIRVDGKIDVARDGSFTQPMTYHLGTDPLYRTVELDKDFEVGNGNRLNVLIDMKASLEAMSLPAEAVSHTTPASRAIAEKYTEQFANAMSIE